MAEQNSKLQFKGYKLIPDDNRDAGKVWDFLFDKVIELRLRVKKSRLPVAPKIVNNEVLSVYPKII